MEDCLFPSRVTPWLYVNNEAHTHAHTHALRVAEGLQSTESYAETDVSSLLYETCHCGDMCIRGRSEIEPVHRLVTGDYSNGKRHTHTKSMNALRSSSHATKAAVAGNHHGGSDHHDIKNGSWKGPMLQPHESYVRTYVHVPQIVEKRIFSPSRVLRVTR